LIKALKDKHPDVQLSAVEALGCIGPAAKIAVPALKQLSADPRFADAVNSAIEKIEGCTGQ
jgi:hypothetical protein